MNCRKTALSAILKKLQSAQNTPGRGITVREAAFFLVDNNLYNGDKAFHADRAAIHFARGILEHLYNYRKVKKIERSAKYGGHLYYLPSDLT